MVTVEEIAGLKGRPVRFVGHDGVLREGIMKGLSGSGSAVVQGSGGWLCVSLEDVFRMGEDMPGGQEGDRRTVEKDRDERAIRRYMLLMPDLEALARFPLEHDVMRGRLPREAYMRRVEELIGKRP